MKRYTSCRLKRVKGGWLARFYFQDTATGRYSKKRKIFRGVTRDQADEMSRSMLKALKRGEATGGAFPTRVDGDPMLLGNYLENYVLMLEQGGGIERTTAINYRYAAAHITRHVDPTRRVDGLSADDVVGMQAALLADGLANNTVARAHRFLKQALQYGMDTGLLASTPFARGVKPPVRTQGDPNALTEESMGRLLAYLEEEGDTPFALGVRLALGCGLRREEVCGLTWSCVDLDEPAISIRKAVVAAGGASVVKGPKTAASARDIPLDPDIAARLRARWRFLRSIFPAGGSTDLASMYVLGDADGSFMRPDRLSKDFTTVAKHLNLVGTTGKLVVFRDLRHSFATCLVKRGVDVKTVSSLMGHSNPSMTLKTYTSSDPSAKRAAMEVMGGVMAERPPARRGGDVLRFRTSA